MISSEVQRTLVKSPPELWAELSDPTALARHLGELGEIRIVRTEPERTVEWAAESTTGTVSIKPSGWGTNVKLTVTREIVGTAPETAAAPPMAGSQPQPGESEPAGAPEPKPVRDEPAAAVEPETGAAVEREREAAAVEAVAVEPEPKPRRGFFARLFGRRRAPAPADLPRSHAQEPTGSPAPERSPEPRSPELPDAFAAVREALAPESFAVSHPYAALPRDISAELMAAEEVTAEEENAVAEEVTAVLTTVLDRLGAAHHRPFSRA
jgi:hypothetical protein